MNEGKTIRAQGQNEIFVQKVFFNTMAVEFG